MLIFRTESNRKGLYKATQDGRLICLIPGIYSSDTKTDPVMQIRMNLAKVLAYLRPGGVVSHASALLGDFGASTGVVTITDPSLSRAHVHEIPGLKVLATPGLGPLPGDTAMAEGLHVSSFARAVLENLEPARAHKAIGRPRQLDQQTLQQRVSRLAPNDDARAALERLCTQVNQDAKGAWAVELGKLHKLTARHKLRSFFARQSPRSEAQGQDAQEDAQADDNASRPLFLSPDVDWPRIRLFEQLAQELRSGRQGNQDAVSPLADQFPSRPSSEDLRFLNFAFFESYFSNYMEGTRFEPEEAHDIATGINPGLHRPRDGHDIRSLYQLYAQPEHFLREDRTPQEYLDNLKAWHAIFGAHADKGDLHPGRFKNRMNFAGRTQFCDPAQVEGTLRQSWEIGRTLAHRPFDHSIFRALSAVSVHPFMDGNGRITRLAAASLMGRSGLIRPFLPTVFREDYILALRAFSDGNCVPAIRMYVRAMAMAKEVPWDRPMPELTAWLREKSAFASPEEARWGAPPARPDEQAEELLREGSSALYSVTRPGSSITG